MIKLVRLKQVSLKDLVTIRRLIGGLNPKNPHTPFRIITTSIRDKNTRVLAIKRKGAIAGFGVLHMYFSLQKKKAVIDDVVIDAAFRGRGLGKKLVRALVTCARKEKAAEVTLTSRPVRVAANKLYRKLGFKKTKTNYYRLWLET